MSTVRAFARLLAPTLLLLGILGPPAMAAEAEGDFRLVTPDDAGDLNAGIKVSPRVNLSDLGLPAYPGATRRRDKEDDMPAVSLGLWGGIFGLKLAVIKYRSHDDFERVVGFYRDALAHYGPVLDCSRGAAPIEKAPEKDSLDCDDDKARAGERVFKVGSKTNQRIFSAREVEGEVHFELVYVRLKGV